MTTGVKEHGPKSVIQLGLFLWWKAVLGNTANLYLEIVKYLIQWEETAVYPLNVHVREKHTRLAFLLHVLINQHLAFVCSVERMNNIRKKEIKKEEHKIKIMTEGNKYTWKEIKKNKPSVTRKRKRKQINLQLSNETKLKEGKKDIFNTWDYSFLQLCS